MMRDVVRQTEDWTIILKRVSDGPNYLAPMGFTAFRPPHGKRFLHIYLRIRNDAKVTRWFGYDSCVVDDGPSWVVPSLVTVAMGVQAVVHGDEEYSSQESSLRMLTFVYSVDSEPLRLRCGAAEFLLPAF